MLLEIPSDIIYQIYSYLSNKKLRELLYISKTNNLIEKPAKNIQNPITATKSHVRNQ